MRNLIRRKHNILYTSSFASLKGGGQRSLYLLLKYINRERFTPFLIVSKKDELWEQVSVLGVKAAVWSFHRVRSFNIFAVLGGLIRLLEIVRRENISLIHAESPREILYASLAGRIIGVPVVFHARVSDSFPWLDRIIYGLADGIIAVSSSVAERFKPFDKRHKVRIVYNAVELDKFNLQEEYMKGDAGLSIAYFGRIDRRKGIELLIAAVKRINADLSLTIMGDGDERYLRELKAMASDPRIVFMPYKAEIIPDIAKTDVVVLPALKGEGMPRILIEAMAMGKVTLVSDVPAHREVLGEELKEFIFSFNNESALQNMIEKILRDKSILSSKRGYLRERAQGLFDVVRNTKMIEEVYGEFLG